MTLNKLLTALFIVSIAAVALYVLVSQNPSMLRGVMQPRKEITMAATIQGSFIKEKQKSDAEWSKILTPAQYHILREEGTEVPYTGSLLHNEKTGTYYSYGCDEPLFRSGTKYDSGTGWPSFYQPISPDSVVLKTDADGSRTEVLDRCGGHLGHVFDDGPEPTGKRFCMNSDALYFVEDKTK